MKTAHNSFRTMMLSITAILLIATPLAAQDTDDACPAMVEEAMTTVGEACEGLGRNEACYGNVQVNATGWEDNELDFTEPGDMANVMELSSLATFPLNTEDNTWGVALLALQANLPETLPGQNVTFVLFGDVELENEVNPNEVVIPPTFTGTATGNINVRTGPDTGYAIAGGLATGDEVTVNGRNEAGDWVQFTLEGEPAWVYAPLLTLEGNGDTLLVTVDETEPAYSAPMQAFRISTGIGESACEEAPRDGIMIQAPEDTTVNFLINGVEVTIGSTALMRLNESASGLSIANLDGTVIVESGDVEEELEVGYQVDVVSGSTPSEPESYAYDDVRSLPVNLLPEPVQIVPPGRIYNAPSVFCGFRDGGEPVATAGEPIAVRSGWRVPESGIEEWISAGAVQRVTYDGEPVELWGVVGPYDPTYSEESEENMYRLEWFWIIPAPQPGQHEIFLMGVETMPEMADIGYEDAPCTLAVR